MIHNHGLWFIIIDYEHNLSNDVFLTYLQNSQISPNSSKFCSFLAKSERFKRLRRTENGRTDGRTHSSNLRLSYTKSPFGAIKQRDVTHIFSRIDVDKSKDQPNRDSVTDLTRQKWILGLDAIWRFWRQLGSHKVPKDSLDSIWAFNTQ